MTISITINLANAAALSILAAALAQAEKTADAQASQANQANPEPDGAKRARTSKPPTPAADTQPAASTSPSAGTGQTAAPSADDTPPFPYVDLQKKVIELHKLDPSRTVAIAKSLGSASFKVLPHGKWVEAKAAVEAAIAELNAAGEVA